MFADLSSTTEDRFYERIAKHVKLGMSRYRHHFWWFVHNCIAHPVIGVCPKKWAFNFHDYTSDKINAKI